MESEGPWFIRGARLAGGPRGLAASHLFSFCLFQLSHMPSVISLYTSFLSLLPDMSPLSHSAPLFLWHQEEPSLATAKWSSLAMAQWQEDTAFILLVDSVPFTCSLQAF